MHPFTLFARFRRFHAPAGMLLVLLQRTPVLRLALPGAEYALSSTIGQVLKGAIGIGAMGAYNSLAGATTFTVVSSTGTATGGAKSTFQIAGTVGTPINGSSGITFSVSGAPGTPRSFGVTNNASGTNYSNTLPPGLAVNPVTGVTSGGAPYYNTNLKLTITGTPTSAGTFTVRFWASDSTAIAGGNSAYVIANFTIAGGVSNVAPSITSQPASQTITAGNSVSFTVAASGSPAPTYQWQKGGVDIGGATSATYTIASAVAGDAGSYTVVATNSAGSATSSAATLTVNAAAVAPSITAQPASQTVTAGNAVSFTVAASGSPAPSYQWRKGGVAIGGATGATYTIASTVAGDAGSYTAVATNSAGSATSSAATLVVNPAAVAPSISTQPASQTVTAGNSVSFTVAANGTPTPTYQWRKGGVDIAGATSPTYTIATTLAGDAGNYTAVATNSAGSATSATATLTVNPAPIAPSITTQPQSATVTVGAAASFSVAASGTAPFSYQWKKGGVSIAGATSATYSITSTQSGDAGSYSVSVSNTAGSVNSSAATLTVNPALQAPAITTQPQSITVTPSSGATFSVTASGTAPLTYQWQKGGVAVAGATSATYTIASVVAGDAGNYTVVVTNGGGSATSSIAVLTVSTVVVAPSITTQPAGAIVTAGSAVSFSVVANGTAPLTYQWKKGAATIAGATTATYSIASAQGGDAASYTVVVTNSAGSATSTAATLTVDPAPTVPAITTQPQALTVTAGGAVSFSVVATGTAPLTYQWSKGGAVLAGATSSSYSIAGAQSSDAGNYFVTVSNSAGSITSVTVALTVNAAVTAPSITTQPQSVSVSAGSGVSFTVAATGTGPLTYQWKKGSSAIAGATSASFLIGSAQTTDAGNYTVVVTNAAGSTTSTIATLAVSAVASAPTITSQPQSLTIATGSSASFSVTAGGTAPFTYQWQKENVAVAGATASSYTISSAQNSDAGNYTVVVTNSAGSVTSSAAALTVDNSGTGGGNSAPAFSTQPVGQTVAPGHSVSFAALATGAPAPTYAWQISTNGGTSWSNLSDTTTYAGITSNTLTVNSAALVMNGYGYRLTASNTAGTVNSNAITLTVTTPALPGPNGLAIDASGKLYVTDSSNNTIQVVTTAGVATVLAGSAGQQGASDGTAGAALFRQPGGVVLDAAGNLFAADTGNSLIRKITPGGVVTTVAGSATNQGYRDGNGTAAWFNSPAALAIDSTGNIYVADTGNSVIRKITSSGAVTTVAGTAGSKGSTDGNGAAARFNQPSGIAMDAAGVIYVSDTSNQTIRRISTSGDVSTWVGLPGVSGADDGTGTSALFNQPGGLALDASSGYLAVADMGNDVIRVISPAGAVATIAGLGGIAGLKDGVGSQAWFSQPKSIGWDSAGNIFVADSGNAAMRKIATSGSVTTLTINASTTTPPVTPPPVVTPPTPTPSSSGPVPGKAGAGSTEIWVVVAISLLGWFSRSRKKVNCSRT